MKAAIISFTARGALKNRELAALLRKKLSCTGYSFYKYARWRDRRHSGR